MSAFKLCFHFRNLTESSELTARCYISTGERQMLLEASRGRACSPNQDLCLARVLLDMHGHPRWLGTILGIRCFGDAVSQHLKVGFGMCDSFFC